MAASSTHALREELLGEALERLWTSLRRRGAAAYNLDPTTCEDAIMRAALATLEALARHPAYGCSDGVASTNRIQGLLWLKFETSCIEILRERQRRPEVLYDEAPGPGTSDARLLERLIAKEKLGRCGQVLERMRPAHAEVIRLTAIGLDQREVEAVTGLAVGNIRQIRRRFRMDVDRLAA